MVTEPETFEEWEERTRPQRPEDRGIAWWDVAILLIFAGLALVVSDHLIAAVLAGAALAGVLIRRYGEPSPATMLVVSRVFVVVMAGFLAWTHDWLLLAFGAVTKALLWLQVKQRGRQRRA